MYSRKVLAFSYSIPGFDPTVVFCYGVYSVTSIYYHTLFYSECLNSQIIPGYKSLRIDISWLDHRTLTLNPNPVRSG